MFMKENNEGDLILIIADLTIGKGPFKDTYKSDVKFNKKDNTIKVTNIGGPLNHLENTWHFKKMKMEQKFILILILKLKINF